MNGYGRTVIIGLSNKNDLSDYIAKKRTLNMNHLKHFIL